jgi:hypothetical protein
MSTRNWGQSQAGKHLKRMFFVDIPSKVKGHSNSLTFPCMFRVFDRSISRQIAPQAYFAGSEPCRKTTVLIMQYYWDFVLVWMKHDIYTVLAILGHSEAPHFAYGVYLCVACDCGNNVAIIPINQIILMIETRCELKVRMMVTMKASLFCIRVEIYWPFGGNYVGYTLLRYVGEFLPDYTVSHPKS